MSATEMSVIKKRYDLNYKPYGDKAILIEWPQRIDDAILDDIVCMRDALTVHLKKSAEIVDVIAAYNSITIVHHHPVVNLKRRIEILDKIYQQSLEQLQPSRYFYQVPVCYEPELASDLTDFLRAKDLTLEQLIALHTGYSYRVCFFGFIPGFMYLSGLAAELHYPRKEQPSKAVPKGSIAIGGKQTGIYPSQSPGGWHVIGLSPLEFIGTRNSLTTVQAGDRVRFESISSNEYMQIKEQVAAGRYRIQRQEIITEVGGDEVKSA